MIDHFRHLLYIIELIVTRINAREKYKMLMNTIIKDDYKHQHAFKYITILIHRK